MKFLIESILQVLKESVVVALPKKEAIMSQLTLFITLKVKIRKYNN